jgi:cysteine desulfurase
MFHTDAVHGLASGPVRVDDIGCHLLSLSAHKIYGPKGIGALYVRRDIQSLVEPLIVGGGQQRGLRAGTLPVALCVGFAAAAERMIGPKAETVRSRVQRLRDEFVSRMLAIKGVVLNGLPLDRRHPGNCNLRFIGCDARDLLARLQPYVAASTGSACTSGLSEPSHVLRACGLSDEDAQASIRFSFGKFTTSADIEALNICVKEALEERT